MAALFVASLVKPSVTAPFFLIVLLRPPRLRPALLVAGGYLGLTVVASAFQGTGIVALLQKWNISSQRGLMETAIPYSNGNLHSWMATVGQLRWYSAAAILCLVALSVWIYRYRFADVWLTIGVAALVSRFYTYHGWYDDVLILLPMLALFRIAKMDKWPQRERSNAKALLVVSLPIMIVPGLYLLPWPWNRLFVLVQTCVWFMFLIFLARLAQQNRPQKAAEFVNL
jgi:hypothetical protein